MITRNELLEYLEPFYQHQTHAARLYSQPLNVDMYKVNADLSIAYRFLRDRIVRGLRLTKDTRTVVPPGIIQALEYYDVCATEPRLFDWK